MPCNLDVVVEVARRAIAAFALENTHDLADPVDATLCVPRLAVPNAPAQTLDLFDDHRLGRHPWRIVGRQGTGDLLQLL